MEYVLDREGIPDIVYKILKINSDDIVSVSKIGGMTNSNYKLSLKNEAVVIRFSKENTKDMINRLDEKLNSYLAYSIGVDCSFLFIDELSGFKVSKFIDKGIILNPNTAKEVTNMKKVVNVLKKLHNSNVKFNNTFDPFDMINKYEKILKEEKGIFFKDYYDVKEKVFILKNVLQKYNISLVPCHNDTVPENFVLDNDKLNMIDWEYSGMNDLAWDLAAHFLECNFSIEESQDFLKIYFDNRVPDDIDVRIKIYKILQDFLWSLWSNIKIKYGENLEDYSLKRYNRSKQLLQQLDVKY